MGDEDEIALVRRQILFCVERKDIFGIPGEIAGAQGLDSGARIQHIHVASRVENGARAVIRVEKKRRVLCFLRFQHFGDDFSRIRRDDAGHDEETEARVDCQCGGSDERDAFHGDFFPKPRRQDGDGKEGGVCVRQIFCRKHLEDKRHGRRPDEQQARRVAHVREREQAFPPVCKKRNRKREAPREETGEKDKDVEIPDAVIVVLGHCRAQVIMHAEEIQNEIMPVVDIHIAVPAAGDERKEDEAGKQVYAEHFFQIFFGEKKEETGQPRQQKPDGSFCERGEGGEKVAEPIIFSVFRVTQIKSGDDHAHEKEKRGVRDNRFGQIPKFE